MPHPDRDAPLHDPAAAPPAGAREQLIRDAEAWCRALFDGHPTALLLYDPASLHLLAVNAAAVAQYGYAREELLAMDINELRPPEDVPIMLAQLAVRTPDGVRRGVFRHRRKDGSVFHVRVTSHPVDVLGHVGRLVIAEDLGEREKVERQLRQAHKMEAVGQLAGGMAHELNNMLTTILATYELMAEAIPGGSELREDLETIHGAVLRGAALTGKLLAFSRRKPLEFRAVDLDAQLGTFSQLLRRLVPASIDLRLRLAAGGDAASADPAAVEEMVVNLVTNACDAMPRGGVLEIATARATLDEAFCRGHAGATAGDYVAVSVRDSGTGMDEATLRRLFEPFFTTKAVGEGAGLGMATVYGLVKQHHGYLEVASRPAAGTTMTLYLPKAGEPSPAPAEPPAPRPGAGERILLVEDEPALRRAASRVLARSGYVVLPAADGLEALELLDRGVAADLVITDIVMPRLSGADLVRALREREWKIPVLVTSGYPGRGGDPAAAVPAGAFFLPKPWTIAELLAAVRRALASPAAGGPRAPAP